MNPNLIISFIEILVGSCSCFWYMYNDSDSTDSGKICAVKQKSAFQILPCILYEKHPFACNHGWGGE